MSCGGGWMVGWICRNVLYYIKGHYKFYYIKFTSWHLTNYQKEKKKKKSIIHLLVVVVYQLHSMAQYFVNFI